MMTDEVACPHRDATCRITLLEAEPPQTICGGCLELLTNLKSGYLSGALAPGQVVEQMVAAGYTPKEANNFIEYLPEVEG